MPSKMVERIAADTGLPNLPSALAGLPASDLQSLMMHVYQTNAARIGIPDLFRTVSRPLLQPSKIDARVLNSFVGPRLRSRNRSKPSNSLRFAGWA